VYQQYPENDNLAAQPSLKAAGGVASNEAFSLADVAAEERQPENA
jgi:hypothetical protein